jgi:hypothetical protein
LYKNDEGTILLNLLPPTIKPIVPIWARVLILPAIMLFALGGLATVILGVYVIYVHSNFESFIFIPLGIFLIYIAWRGRNLYVYRNVVACIIGNDLVYANDLRSVPNSISIFDIKLIDDAAFQIYHLIDSKSGKTLMSTDYYYGYSMSLVHIIISFQIEKANEIKIENLDNHAMTKVKYIELNEKYEKGCKNFDVIQIFLILAIIGGPFYVIKLVTEKFAILFMGLLLMLSWAYLIYIIQKSLDRMKKFSLLCSFCQASIIKAKDKNILSTGKCSKCGHQVFKVEIVSETI